MSNPVEHLLQRMLPPHVDVIAVPEYELRHGNGDVDTFDDIGDAVDFQEQFPTARLFRREVTRIAVRSPWTEIEEADPSPKATSAASQEGSS